MTQADIEAVQQTDMGAVWQTVEVAVQQSDVNYKVAVHSGLCMLDVALPTALSVFQSELTTCVVSLPDRH